ncbi:hypothetical protein [Gordonia sp. VNK21]|uniref:hypothetical protein n=1 Tax=Gordonia sp. VNK21 TaxID=3382483 RepID=UPI0038D4B47C
MTIADSAGPPGTDHGRLFPASARDGSIALAVTADGLPVTLSISPGQLAASPERLAERIVALCAVARAGAGLHARAALIESGAGPEVTAALGLTGREDLVRLEADADRLWEQDGGVR